MSETVSDQFRSAMKDWVELKKQLTSARKDMKILNTREKQLKEYIKNYMKKTHIDKINLKGGKVTLKVSQKSGTFTKAAVQKGLHIYFQGDEVRMEAVMTCILDNIEKKESEVISLTGLKKQDSD
jgi:ferritin-like metal-binding protein YciE